MKKKRILVFCLSYYPNVVSGAEAALKEITARISPDDLEFHLVTLRCDSTIPKTEQMGNLLVHRIGLSKPHATREDLGRFPLDLNKPLFQFLAPLEGMRLHRRYHFDAVWAMMAHSSGVPAVLFKLRYPRIPYALTLQEGDPTDYIEKTMRPLWPLFARAFTKADVIQAISASLADWARRRGARAPIELIANGANPKDLHGSVSPEEVEALKQSLGKKPGDVYLVNTARLVKQKGYDVVIRALALLPARVKFLVVGGGEEDAALKALARELHLEDRILFVGEVDRSAVTAYRLAGDIFVCPSRSEGLGNAFLSAMASRVPVIATQEGGLADFVFDAARNPDKETTAWAVDKDNPAQIAAAVTDILAHPEKVAAVTDAARRMVLEKYDWDRIAREMREKVFGRILAS